MTTTFPVGVSDFMALLPIRSVRWRLSEFYEESGTALGQIIRSEIAAPKWLAEVEIAPQTHDNARRVRSIIRRIGKYGTFNLYNPAQAYPASDPDGSIVGSSTVTIHAISGRTIRLTGLPASYDLAWGDMISVSGSGYRGLFEVNDDISANGSGITGFFEVTPSPKAWMDDGDSVDLKKPTCRMMFLDYDEGGSEIAYASGGTFTAIEAP
jgi:hypothetical protein